MRLAYFTPLPPGKSGIADYNSELLPYLARGAEISVFVEEAGELRENRDRADFSVHDANDFDGIHGQRPFDLCVYHLGNNPHHEYIYERATVTPGLLVMHESCLHHLVAWKTLRRKRLLERDVLRLREEGRARGRYALSLHRERLSAVPDAAEPPPGSGQSWRHHSQRIRGFAA